MQCFAIKDLPEGHRIVRPGEMTTMDHNPNRYVRISQMVSC
jgi:hypothetical protein